MPGNAKHSPPAAHAAVAKRSSIVASPMLIPPCMKSRCALSTTTPGAKVRCACIPKLG